MKIIKPLTILVTVFVSLQVISATTYEVQASANDETFIINDEVFKARTYCYDIRKGDEVIFLEGSANGICVSAKFYNKRTEETCDVYCE